MQDPNEDSEWNDVFRAKGILPPMSENAFEKRTGGDKQKNIEDMNMDESEDSQDESVREEYLHKRLAYMQAFADKVLFGSVWAIFGKDYVNEVTKAGEGIWVVLHLYTNGVPLCSVIHHHMQQFLRSIATTCIPNLTEKHLPTMFIYFEGQMRKQFIGALELRG
ncbi:viral IAP-associated factor homolog [Eupeodes corollae]|uniref:viral IAP-associated factor homolog n=1 Tax=Eupeodes corollae TaxID=290404 RepID=UPI00248FC49B|nr:viral IAP-associated factor homolog [Eupeodes corollae]